MKNKIWKYFKILNILNKTHQHNFLAIESVGWKGILYNRIIIYRCSSCGQKVYSNNWAFAPGAGSLDCFYPKDKDYTHTHLGIETRYRIDEEEEIQLQIKVLSKHFEVKDRKVHGTRVFEQFE